jgi:hypothetical protein
MRRGVMEQMVSLISLGDGSTLSLDFTTGVLDSRLTFSRSTGGSYVHSDGLLYGFDTSSSSNTIGTGSKTFTISATAGVNRRYAVGDLIIASSGANNMSGSVTSYDPTTQALVCSMASSSGSGTFTTWIIGNRQPRFDHDPTTLAPRGLLVEGQSVNLITYSNDFSVAFWALDNSGATNPSVSTVSQTGPDGAATVTRITFNKTGGTFSRIRNTAVGTASQPYTMSVWMKANTASGGASTQNVGLRIGADSAGFNCVVTTTWKRFQYTYTLSGTDASAQIMLWDNIIGNDETADVLVYGCQIEAGSGASSYIPTGASQATRNADSCVMTGTNFSSWYNQSQGSFFASVQKNTTSVGHIFNANTSNSAPRIMMTYNSGWYLAGENPSGTNTPSVFIATGAINASQKVAGAFQTGNYAASANGLTAVTTSTGTMPTGLNTLQIGAAEGGYQYFNGTIALLKYWPTRLPNAQLQSLTT